MSHPPGSPEAMVVARWRLLRGHLGRAAGRGFALRGSTAFERRQHLDDRWSKYRTLLTVLVLAIGLLPTGFEQRDVLIVGPVALALFWYVLRSFVRPLRELSHPRRRQMLAVLEFVAFSALLVYVAGSYSTVRVDLLVLYLWPLYTLYETAGTSTAVAGFLAVVTVAALAVFIAGSDPAALQNGLSALFLTALLIGTIIYLNVRGGLAGEERSMLSAAIPLFGTSHDIHRAAARAAAQLIPDVTIASISAVKGRTVDSTAVLVRRGSTHPPAERMLSMHPAQPLLDKYLDREWRDRRRGGKRTLVVEGDPSKHAPMAALMLAPAHSTGRDVVAVLRMAYTDRGQPPAGSELGSLDQLAQQLASELVLFQLRTTQRDALRIQIAERLMDDLHDTVRTELHGAIDVLHATRPSNNVRAATVDTAIDLIQTALSGLTFLGAHHTGGVSLTGLRARLRSFLAYSVRSAPVTLWSSDLDGILGLTPDEAVDLYLMLREAMRNAIVHGQASQIEVTVVETTSGLAFTVIDNGVGFDTVTTTGDGLTSMANRAASIGAGLEVTSQIGIGSWVTVGLPRARLISVT